MRLLPLELLKTLPSSVAVVTPPQLLGPAEGWGGIRGALGPGLISLVLIPSLGETCQWRKARRGEWWAKPPVGKVPMIPRAKEAQRLQRTQWGGKSFFWVVCSPKCKTKRASWPAKCPIAPQVSLSGTERGPLGPGRHSHMTLWCIDGLEL